MATGHTHVKKHIKKSKFYESRELIIRNEHTQVYARVDSALGAGRFMVTILDENIRANVGLPGSLMKGPRRQKVEPDNIVLLTRISESNVDIKYQIELIYSKQHINELLAMKEIVELNPNNKKNKSNVIILDESNVVFSNDDNTFQNDNEQNNEEIDFDAI